MALVHVNVFFIFFSIRFIYFQKYFEYSVVAGEIFTFAQHMHYNNSWPHKSCMNFIFFMRNTKLACEVDFQRIFVNKNIKTIFLSSIFSNNKQKFEWKMVFMHVWYTKHLLNRINTIKCNQSEFKSTHLYLCIYVYFIIIFRLEKYTTEN